MKIGNLDIKKAYFGTTPLTSSNAFIGEVPIIAGPAPVTIDYFYLQPSTSGDYSVGKKDLVYVKGDTFEFSKNKTNWRRFDSLTTGPVTRTLAAFMEANGDYGVLALSISAYNTYVVGQGLEVGCYNSTTPATGTSNHGATATLITTDENYAYYMCQIGAVPSGSTQFRWFIQESGTTTYTKRSGGKSISLGTPYMMTWDGETTTPAGVVTVDPENYNVNVTTTEITETIHLNANDKLYLRNTSGLDITSSTSTQTVLMPSIQSNVNYNIGGVLHTIYDYTAQNIEEADPGSYGAYRLFYNDTHIINAGNLTLSTTTNSYSYSTMFKGCTSLTSAPALPATTLATRCYNSMFYNCSALTAAPAMAPTSVNTYVCSQMFYGCTNLSNISSLSLPATTLAQSCYDSMFYNCSALTTAPALPATTLAQNCYSSMFRGCTSLTSAPTLPATVLVTSCYSSMFRGCTSLNYVECMAVSNINTTNCSTWLDAVAATGTFKRNVGSTIGTGGWTLNSESGIPSGWTNEASGIYVSRNEINASAGSRYYGVPYFVVIKAVDEINITTSDSWLTCSRLNSSVTAVADDYKILLGGNNTGQDRTGTVTVTSGNYTETITVKQCRYESDEMFTINAVENSTIGFGMNGSPTITPVFEYSLDGVNWLTWTYNVGSTIPLNAGQKVMIRGNNSGGINNNETNYSSFTITGNVTLSGNIMSLLDSTMSMTALPVDNCFYSLFRECTGITKTHELVLPLGTVRQAGYNKMFYHCTSLYNTPHLQASVVNGNGYIRMFEGCTSLVDASPVKGSTLGSGCYANMFIGCTSLTHAPEINEYATASDMLYNAFNSCTNLRYVKCMIQSQTGTTGWMNGVQTNGGLFVRRNGTYWSDGASGVPANWTKVAA